MKFGDIYTTSDAGDLELYIPIGKMNEAREFIKSQGWRHEVSLFNKKLARVAGSCRRSLEPIKKHLKL